jgi:hypothetical protein
MNQSSRKSNSPLSERRVISMNRKMISFISTETERQARWIAKLKANTEVRYDPEMKRWIVEYYEES